MRQNSRKTTANMITMEEYLKKRQAMKRQEEREADTSMIPVTAMKLAEILFV